jgi:hypothetical protein
VSLTSPSEHFEHLRSFEGYADIYVCPFGVVVLASQDGEELAFFEHDYVGGDPDAAYNAALSFVLANDHVLLRDIRLEPEA